MPDDWPADVLFQHLLGEANETHFPVSNQCFAPPPSPTPTNTTTATTTTTTATTTTEFKWRSLSLLHHPKRGRRMSSMPLGTAHLIITFSQMLVCPFTVHITVSVDEVSWDSKWRFITNSLHWGGAEYRFFHPEELRTLLQQGFQPVQASCTMKSSDTQPVAMIVFMAAIPYPLTNHMVLLL